MSKKLVSELSVEELLEYTNYVETKKQLDEVKKQLDERVIELDALKEQSTSLFGDAKKLESVSTPFRICSDSDVEGFITFMRAARENGKVILLAAALEGPEGAT